MRYSPKPGKTEGFCIGMSPGDRDLWNEIVEELQKQRNTEVVLQGDDLSVAMETFLMEDSDTRAQLQVAANNTAVEKLREQGRQQKIHAIVVLFRSLVKV